MAERVGRLEEWTKGHEQRCEDHMTTIGHEIRDLKTAIGRGEGQKWALILALCAWALSQVYDNIKPRPPAAVAVAAAPAALPR